MEAAGPGDGPHNLVFTVAKLGRPTGRGNTQISVNWTKKSYGRYTNR